MKPNDNKMRHSCFFLALYFSLTIFLILSLSRPSFAQTKSRSKPTWEQVVSEAKKEGKVVYWTTMRLPDAQALAQGFESKYPFMKAEIVRIIDDYQPHAILLSAGFDAHRRDPLGGMNVTEDAYGEITRRVVECAKRWCGGRVISLLEGGYDLEGLASSVAHHVDALRTRRERLFALLDAADEVRTLTRERLLESALSGDPEEPVEAFALQWFCYR